MAGIPGAAAGTLGFSLYAGTLKLEPTDAIFGLDPMVALGLGGVGCGVVGFFAGSFLSGVVWRLVRPTAAAQMDLRKTEFHEHVTRMRAPPETLPISGGGVGVPTPDFYGEKVTSVAGYREWLRKQRRQCTAAGGAPLERPARAHGAGAAQPSRWVVGY